MEQLHGRTEGCIRLLDTALEDCWVRSAEGREIKSEGVKESGEEGHQLLEHELVAERNGPRPGSGRQLSEERGDELFAFLKWLRSKIGELTAARDPFMERACTAPGKES